LAFFFFSLSFQKYQMQTSLVFLGDIVENWRALGIKRLKLEQLKGEEDFSYNIFNLFCSVFVFVSTSSAPLLLNVFHVLVLWLTCEDISFPL